MECSNAYSHQWIQTLLMVKPRSITHTMKKGVHWGQTRNKTPIAPVRALQRLNGCTFLQRFAIPVRTQLIVALPHSRVGRWRCACGLRHGSGMEPTTHSLEPGSKYGRGRFAIRSVLADWSRHGSAYEACNANNTWKRVA